MKHIVFDCETMSEKPTAAIVSIGAVQFDNKPAKLVKNFT